MKTNLSESARTQIHALLLQGIDQKDEGYGVLSDLVASEVDVIERIVVKDLQEQRGVRQQKLRKEREATNGHRSNRQ